MTNKNWVNAETRDAATVFLTMLVGDASNMCVVEMLKKRPLNVMSTQAGANVTKAYADLVREATIYVRMKRLEMYEKKAEEVKETLYEFFHERLSVDPSFSEDFSEAFEHLKKTALLASKATVEIEKQNKNTLPFS